MKTPEQIANEIAIEVGHREDSHLAWAIAVGIERDRAQREIGFDTLDHMLSAWENYDGDDVPAFMQAWLDHFNTGAQMAEEFKA